MRHRPPIVTGEVRVDGVEQVAARVRRVTLSGDPLADYRPARPGEAFRLMRPPDGAARVDFPHAGSDGLPQWSANQQRPSLRAFTVRSVPDPGTITFDVMERDDQRWPSKVVVGDLLGVAGMRHGYAAPPPARHHALVGDRSALPAISSVLDLVDPASRCSVALAVDDPAERDLLPRRTGVEVHWLPTDCSDGALGNTLREMLAGGVAPDHLLAIGEVRQVAAAHAVGVDLGLAPNALQPIVYWERGLSTDERDPAIYRRYARAAQDGRDVSTPQLIADLELSAVGPNGYEPRRQHRVCPSRVT